MEYSIQQENDRPDHEDLYTDSHPDSDILFSSKKPETQCTRYLISLLVSLTFFNALTTRACMNVAVVAMVNSTSTPSVNDTGNECPSFVSNASTNNDKVGELNWSFGEESNVISVFYYGYIITQLPGGYLAERFSSKFILGFILISSSFLSCVSPFLARFDVRALIACRFLLGLCQGPLYPSVQALWGVWAPPLERTRLMAIGFSGSTIGDLVGFSLTGYLCSLSSLGGWPIPFYVFGCFSGLSFIVWMFAYNDPPNHKCLSDDERAYITTSIYGCEKAPKYSNPPWKLIFTSRPFYGLLLFTLFDGIAYYVIFACGPTYMKQILHFDITSNGLVTAAPYLANFFTGLAAGPIVDFILTKRWFSVTKTRKAVTLIAGLISSAFVVAMGYVDCSQTLAVLFLVLSWGVGGFQNAGPVVSSLDISPKHAGVIVGMLNILNNFGGFLSPVLVLQLTKGQPNRVQWQKVFFMTAAFQAGSVLCYVLLASSKEQNWSSSSSSSSSTSHVEENNSRSSNDDERQPILEQQQQRS